MTTPVSQARDEQNAAYATYLSNIDEPVAIVSADDLRKAMTEYFGVAVLPLVIEGCAYYAVERYA